MASNHVTFRCSPELKEMIQQRVESLRRSRKRCENYTVTQYIVDCIVEKTEHLERSKKSAAKRRKKVATVDQCLHEECPFAPEDLPFDPDPPGKGAES